MRLFNFSWLFWTLHRIGDSRAARLPAMDEKEFKKHLKDLAHGHHRPEEHDWAPDGKAAEPNEPAKATRARRPKGRTESETAV
jgi:hypothetical protein